MTGLASFVAASGSRGVPVIDPSAATPEARALSFLGRHGKLFGLRRVEDLRLLRTHPRDIVGMDHVRFQQLHEGVPVTGGELMVHLRGSRVMAANGRILPPPAELDMTPAVGGVAAGAAARDILAKHLNVTDAETSEPRLEVLNRGFIGGPPSPTRLAWFIEARKLDVREYVWVDAIRGGVLLHFSQLTRARNRRIYTANNTATLPGTLIRVEGGASTGDSDADKAYDYAGDTYDYYFTQHSRDSYDGAGAMIKSTVHFCEGGCPFQNAFWNGAQMVYGEGFSVADDVDAHELTHAVTEHSAGLFYYMQSGALNESFSDIFGETVDLTNGAGDDSSGVRWLMGEEVPGFGAVRDMMDPTQFGDPDRMGDDSHFKCNDSALDDSGGVHSNSGVPNHAYALMVDGGSFNGQTMTGIGLTKAATIQYRVLTEYLISSSDFLDDSEAIQQACTDLLGTSGITTADCTQVTKALDAVEMSDPWPCVPPPTAEPAACPIGEGPADLFFDDFENRTSGNWAASLQSGSVNAWLGGTGTPAIYFHEFATSGVYHLWGFDVGERTLSSVAMTRSVILPAGAKMSFRHSYGFENVGSFFFDGGVLEFSTNGGASWADAGGFITAGADYNGSISTSSDNPLEGRAAFVGESWGYTGSVLDLSSLAGQSVRFRFRVATDFIADDYGWFIDDVRIFTCDVGGSVQFGAPVFSVSEGTANATITVTRTGGTAGGVTVDYSTSDDSALTGQDYTATSGTLTFPSFVTSRTFSVPILNDLLDDEGEAFGVNLSGVTGPSATLGAQPTAEVDIVDNDSAGAVQFSAASYSVSEAGPVATITVTRSGSAAGATVNYQTTSGGSATGALDYAPVAGTLTFGAGILSRTFTVPITNDTLDEANETVNLLLDSPGGGAVLGARTTAVLTILDNDSGGVLKFSALNYSVSEGAGSATITVTRSSGLASGVTVQYTTEDGTAQAGADYATSNGTLSFGANETTKTFTVPILEDSLGEANETVKLNLLGPTGGAALGAPSLSTLTILENEAVMQFTLPNYTVTEAGPAAVIGVKRSSLLSGTTTVAYRTSDASATAGADYAAQTGTLTFAPGATLRTFTVPIVNDTTWEPPEVLLLSLSSPSGAGAAIGAQATAALTITDNDAAFRFSSATYMVSEGSAAATITVQRINSSAGTATVDYAATGGTATDDVDFTAVSGTLTFAPGVVSRTFTVPIVNDTDPEEAETVNLALTPGAGTGLGSPSTATLTITDDEPRLRFSSASYMVSEAAVAATITVQRTGSTAAAATVDYAATGGTATDDVDFTTVSGTLSFPPGVVTRTFAVPILGDTDPEGAETVNLSLTPGAGAGLAPPAAATLTINDNEILFRFSAASYAVSEATTAATITVQRLNSAAGTVSVNYAATGGTATDDVDFTAVSGTLSFAPGVVARTFQVPIVNDAAAEGSETVNLALSGASAGTTISSPGTATLTINDNETLFRFSSAAYTAAETTASAIITVQRLNSSVGTVTVDYSATGGSATDNVDFTAVSGTLSFPPGVLTRTFAVPIVNDAVDENIESVALALSNPGAGTNLGTPNTATLSITDNDTAGTLKLSAATYSAAEGAGVVRISVTRSGGGASTSVHYTLQDVDAQAGSDYTDNGGVVSFTTGELTKSFEVPILDDPDVETNESFSISLSGPEPGAILGSPTSAVIYIVDDDS